MTDYISREAFAAEMKERQTEAGKWLRDAKDHDTAVRADAVLSFLCEVKLTLDKLPAADVRPVITCGECKHNNACLTQAFVEEESRAPFDRNTFFCADGERVDDA